MNKSANKPLAIIVGAGPGLGHALARTLSAANYQVAGLIRSPATREISEMEVMELDTADHMTVSNCINGLTEKYGPPSVLIHNTAQLYIKPFIETTPEEFKLAWQSMVLSAVNTMQSVLPAMEQQKKGTIIASGATASLRGGARFSAFASAKFALRGLTQSLAREYQSRGVHIAHVILDGILDTERSRELHTLEPSRMIDTAEVAKAYLQIVEQSPSAWTHELDLRPSTESF